MTDIGYQNLERRTGRKVTDLAAEYEQILSAERAGNRLYDTTDFRNYIPYGAGQTEGAYHTWYDILSYQTSHEDFVFA
jgi:hypothetical protein